MENSGTAANEPLEVIIDLSHHNRVSELATIKATGVLGVIHKATQGIGYTDPEYAHRRAAASGIRLAAHC